MYFRLPEQLQASLRVTDHAPKAYAQYLMPHAAVVFIQFTGGVILSQWLQGRDYRIWQHHFILEAPTEVYPFTSHGILTLNYVLRGTIPCHLHGFGDLTLRSGYHQLFYVPPGNEHSAQLPQGLSITVQVEIDSRLMQRVAQEHAAFQTTIQKAASGQPNGEQHLPSPINREIATLLQAITTCELPESERALFLEARVRDLILHYVQDQAKQAAIAAITSREQKIVTRLQHYLQDRLDQPLTVNRIAADLELSASTLQTIVRRYYHEGIHHLLHGMRMRKAMDLLLSTDLPIGNIAARVTPASFTYFTRSFKSHFGHSPAYYRQSPGLP